MADKRRLDIYVVYTKTFAVVTFVFDKLKS